MTYNKVTTVKHNGVKVSYTQHVLHPVKGAYMPIDNYTQQDSYSCGFIAALAVTRYFFPFIDPKSVLEVLDLDPDEGVDRDQMVYAMTELGIRVKYRDDLDIDQLNRLLNANTPVMLSVWPEGWNGDHWTVLRGISHTRVYLCNHYTQSIKSFRKEWIDNWDDGSITGAGLICKQE